MQYLLGFVLLICTACSSGEFRVREADGKITERIMITNYKSSVDLEFSKPDGVRIRTLHCDDQTRACAVVN